MNKNDLSLFDFESHYFITESRERLSGLRKYLAIMDTQVARIESEQSEQLKKDLETIPDSWSDADQYSYIQWRENEYLFQSSFAESFRYSFIILVWIVIEDELKRVCVEIQRRKGQVPQQWKRIGVFYQCKTILKDVAGVTGEKIAHWSSICDLQKIRNCIVHTSGFVDEASDKDYLIQLVEGKRPILQIDDDKRLIISTEFCKLAVQNTTDFFAEVFNVTGIRIWKESEK